MTSVGDMAPFNPKKVTAYNVKEKIRDDPMKVTAVIKTPVTKEGVRTGKFRYRLAGTGTGGAGMSRIVSEEQAKAVAKAQKMKITEKAPKAGAGKRKKKSCKKIGEEAEERCVKRRAKKSK